jgi:class 3 adenylate cyclase
MEFDKQLLADSLANAEKELLSEIRHQTELRNKDRIKNFSIALGFILLLASFGLWSRLNYIRKSREEIRNEKDRSEALLLNILPAEVAAELKEKGRAAARDFNMVSILFTDFKEFTLLSESLSAQDLVSEINTCFEAFDNICEQYNVEKIKTIGDSYMAAGGLPIPSEDSVKNLVLAALDMSDFILKRKATGESLGNRPFEMRVGINTGPVVAGIVGVKKFQYDIWGDTVNTAARMESNGVVGRVNISATTYEVIKDDPQFTFESRGKVNAKGKGEIQMYFVDRAKPVVF